MTAQDMSAALDMADMASVEDMPARDMPAPVDMPATTDMADMSAGEDMPDDEDMLALDMADMTSPCVHETRGDDVTVICDGSELLLIHETPDGLFELGADVTLPPNWRPVPNFFGSFDGKGHRITGINLEQAIPEPNECSGTTIFRGGFIDTMRDGILQNVHFDGVVGGSELEPLRSSIETGEHECGVYYGGVIGRIDGTVNSPVVKRAYVSGLNVWVVERFGGVTSTMDGGTLEDVHLLGSRGENTIHTEQGLVGGIAHNAKGSSFTRVSAQLSIAQAGGGDFNRAGLIVATAQDPAWSSIVARGDIVANATDNTNSLGGIGGSVTVASSGKGRLFDCAVEPWDVGPIVQSTSARVGGIWGGLLKASGGSDNLSFEMRRCRVGAFEFSPPPLVQGSFNVGGVIGEVVNTGVFNVIIDSVYIAGSVIANTSCSCHVGFERADTIVTTTGAPESAMSIDGTSECDGYATVKAALPDGWIVEDEMRFDLMVVDQFFGPLRDQSEPPEMFGDASL